MVLKYVYFNKETTFFFAYSYSEYVDMISPILWTGEVLVDIPRKKGRNMVLLSLIGIPLSCEGNITPTHFCKKETKQ